MKEEVKVSVIVPVYNSEKYLDKCIQSILNQTYTNFELLLINDGSKDDSGVICDKYAVQDARVRVFHQENGGVSSARNKGLDNATGEWICFVDSDDWVSIDYISDFYINIASITKTLIVQRLTRVINGESKPHSKFIEGLYVGNNFSELFSVNELITKGGPVAKLYNMRILGDAKLRFNIDINYAEDLLFMLHYIIIVGSVYLSNKSNYFYRDTRNSLSKTYNKYDEEINTFNFLNRAFVDIKSKYNLTIEAQESFYKNNLGYQLQRSILTMYRPENKEKRINRVSIIRSLNNRYNINILDYYTKHRMKINRIGFWLFKHKLFIIYDLYYSMVYKLRYLLNKYWIIYLKSR